jgi:hypothetical protein
LNPNPNFNFNFNSDSDSSRTQYATYLAAAPACCMRLLATIFSKTSPYLAFSKITSAVPNRMATQAPDIGAEQAQAVDQVERLALRWPAAPGCPVQVLLVFGVEFGHK